MHSYKHSNPSIAVADPITSSSLSYHQCAVTVMGMKKHSPFSFPSLHNLFSFLLPFYLSGKEMRYFFTGKVNRILDYIEFTQTI